MVAIEGKLNSSSDVYKRIWFCLFVVELFVGGDGPRKLFFSGFDDRFHVRINSK